jgi:prepilin-type N-terminal cleavage/methylation domain-containing protein
MSGQGRNDSQLLGHRAAGRIRARRAPSAGFTLLEMLLVMGLVGLMMGAGLAGFRALTKAELRGSSARLASAIRYLFDRASTTGKIHRLVFDFEAGKYWAEVSDDAFFLPREAETEESRTKEVEAIAEEKRLEDEAREREASGQTSVEEELIDPTRYQPTEWKPKRARFEKVGERVVKTVELRKVKLAGLFTPRYAQPIHTGQGYLYFFPLGQTEPAIVHVSDEKGESFYSLLVHPLNGRVKVASGFVEPRIDTQFDDEGNEVVRP